jgi:hypothetical protein
VIGEGKNKQRGRKVEDHSPGLLGHQNFYHAQLRFRHLRVVGGRAIITFELQGFTQRTGFLGNKVK